MDETPWFGVLYSPRAVAWGAVRAHWGWAAAACIVGVTVVVATPLAALVGVSPPYLALSFFVRDVVRAALLAWAVLGGLVTVLALGAVVPLHSDMPDERDRAILRAFGLGTISGVVPTLAWGPFLALKQWADASVGTPPAWVDSPVVRVLGSEAWLVVILGLVVWMTWSAVRKTAELFDESTGRLCRRCGYDLSGLDEAGVRRCPECGRELT